MSDGFDAPGSGCWELDRSHHTGGTTPIAQHLMASGIEEGGADLFRTLGLPVAGVDPAYVQGYLYVRMRSAFGARTPRRLPPPAMIRRVFSATPLGRECERTAERAIANRPWERALASWPDRARELIEENLAWQDVEEASLSDAALLHRAVALTNHAARGFAEHFRLHGLDLVPIGMAIAEARRVGIDRASIFGALTGVSPATSAPQEALDRLADLVGAPVLSDGEVGEDVDLEDVRALGPEIATAIDEFLDRYGSTVVEGYDIDGRTLAEVPDLIARRILRSPGDNEAGPRPKATGIDLAATEAGVSPHEREYLIELVAQARLAVGIREEQGPLTIQWPLGLLRGTLLHIGRRQVLDGEWEQAELALELRPQELRVTRRENLPSNEELVERRQKRLELRRLIPPETLGRCNAPTPQPEWFPPAVAKMVELLLITTSELGVMNRGQAADGDAPIIDPRPTPVLDSGNETSAMATVAHCYDELSLVGTGVGTKSVSGRARVATNLDDALGLVEPGEILVTHATSPAYNLILGQVRGLVTTNGGAISHAAILARELGFPAVVGVPGATEQIHTGDRIRIDPLTGTVERLSKR